MPRGDRTGPDGFGPRSGRGLGFCNGYDSPGYTKGSGRGMGNPWGRAFGRAFGRGFGRGFRGRAWGPYYDDYNAARPVSDDEYKQILKDEHDALKQRIGELEKEMNKSGDE